MNRPGTVLILDDATADLALRLRPLSRFGWTVEIARNRLEAMALVGRLNPDVFVVALGEKSTRVQGLLAALRRMRAEVPVLAIRRDASSPSPSSRFVDRHLTEPVEALEIHDVLREMTRRGRERSAEVDVRGPEASTLRRILRYCRELTELERDREQLVIRALDALMDVTRCLRGSLFLRVQDSDQFDLVRQRGFPDAAAGGVSLTLGADIAGTIAKRGEPVICQLDRSSRAESARGYSGSSFLILPLRSERITVGVANLTDRIDDRPFEQADLVAASLIAEHTTVALANARTLADLHEMTVIDPLTQLYNRRHFDREVKKEIERARRHGRRLTLALLDIDRFKSFNDLNGYVTGDTIIRRVASIIQKSFREVDVVTRWGGDEFAVLLPDTNRPRGDGTAGHENFIERVRSAVEGADVTDILPPGSPRITVSIGVASFSQDAAGDAELFARANAALKRSKRLGGNRASFAGDADGAGDVVSHSD